MFIWSYEIAVAGRSSERDKSIKFFRAPVTRQNGELTGGSGGRCASAAGRSYSMGRRNPGPGGETAAGTGGIGSGYTCGDSHSP